VWPLSVGKKSAQQWVRETTGKRIKKTSNQWDETSAKSKANRLLNPAQQTKRQKQIKKQKQIKNNGYQ
jgi:hypothetical protein